MKNLKLSTKILSVSIFILFVFSLASFGILFRALSNQSFREMDQLLKSETLALSSLINSTLDDGFEFEMHSDFLAQYHTRNPNGFFRFIDPRNGKVLKESLGAPAVSCDPQKAKTDVQFAGTTYLIESLLFTPELDYELETPPTRNHIGSPVCLITGIDKAPYWNVLMDTLFSSIPILIFIVVVLVILLLILIRGLTKDLQILNSVLTAANFGSTYEFPVLPRANTQEVASIVTVLEELHGQAAQIYREMWLFMGRAAHQIKTPVTAMQATVDVLLRKDRTREELLSGLEDVRAAAGHLNGLTKKLISSSRTSFQESPPTEIIELSIFLKETVEIFRSQADERGVRLTLASEPLTYVVGNRSLMSDVFSNLIENAILYSSPISGSQVELSWQAIGDEAVIEVTDQGVGFPISVQKDLFKPFVRGDERKVSGSGLGLSIVKKSIDLLGGRIELVETSKAGSRMRVSLPLKPV